MIEVNQIGNIMPGTNRENPNQGRVYDKQGLAPTLSCMGGGNLQPMIVEDYVMPGNNFNQCNKVHSEDGICRTIMGSGHTGNESKVIVASRGRNTENPSDRKQGIKLEQRLEPNSEGICNTLTSVQKDNLVLKPAILTPKRTEYGKAIRKDYEKGNIQESRHNMTELQPRTDGICNTLTTVQKDNLLLENCIDFYNNSMRTDECVGTITTNSNSTGSGVFGVVQIKQATKYGYIECKIGGVADLLYPTSKTRRGRVQDNGDTCPTLTANEMGVYKIKTPYRIRKLTPKECWRLMSFTDEDFHKAEQVNSNTQLYKQAGNSIVVNVLEGIFKNLL